MVGGGLLGLEAAKAVYDLEDVADVTIVHRQAFPLSRQLDAQGGEIVLRRIEAMGVRVLMNASARACVSAPGDPHVLRGLEMMDGEVLDAQMVIFAIGITPRDDLARKAGIACEERGGITVNDSLQTSASDVYAIGECASWNRNTYGLIAPGSECSAKQHRSIAHCPLQSRWPTSCRSILHRLRPRSAGSRRDKWSARALSFVNLE